MPKEIFRGMIYYFMKSTITRDCIHYVYTLKQTENFSFQLGNDLSIYQF